MFLNHFLALNQEEVLLSYRGPVTSAVLHEISSDLRGLSVLTPTLQKKVFRVFMEVAQNVHFYSEETCEIKGEQVAVGAFALTRGKNGYHITTANAVTTTQSNRLTAHCKRINSLSRQDLRRLKYELRSKPQAPGSKGAGVGFIQVALVSDDKLRCECHTLSNEKTYFVLTVHVQESE